jgi:hypothetical protein
MRTRALICILFSISLFSPNVLLYADELASSRRESFEKWMTSSGLSRNFEIVRIGQGPHPAPELSKEEREVLHLELRFIDESPSQAAEIARFQRVLAAYQEKYSATLPEKIFYEFTHTFAVGRRGASVDFHVLEDQYSVYVSPADSELIVREVESRSPRHFSVTISLSVSKEQFRAHSAGASADSIKQVSNSVEDILKTYFLDASKRKGLAKPDITPVREDGYLGLTVGGLKGLVTDRYWEWLSIDIEFHSDSAEPSPQPLWKFSCYVHAKYASSPNDKSPYDADTEYASRVEKLRNQLVDELQKKLEKGSHD